MAKEMLYDVPLWSVALGLLTLLLLAATIGFKMGRRRVARATAETQDEAKDGGGAEFSTVQSAILGLLALLLAFTYSLASSRHDDRRRVVVDEANAIGTAWLRAGVVEEPARGELLELLRRYVDLRLELAAAPEFTDSTAVATRASEEVQSKVWAVIERRTAAGAKTPIDGLLMLAVNDMIDLHTVRLAALRDHVPEIVLFLLMFVATVALGIVGFAAGCRGRRNLILTGTLSLLIVAVIAVTMDLDRPRRGLVRTSQQPMIDLQASIRPPK